MVDKLAQQPGDEGFDIAQVDAERQPVPDRLPLSDDEGTDALRQAAEDAVGEAQAEERPVFIKPRQLAGIKEITKKCYMPEPYDHYWVMLWVNPSDLEVERAAKTMSLSDYLLHWVRGWNLEYAEVKDPETGEVLQPAEPVPLTSEGLLVLPGNGVQWLMMEFGQQRLAPLVRKPKDTSSTIRESALTRNGSAS